MSEKYKVENKDIAGSQFRHVNMSGTVFEDVDLSGARFFNINLRRANIGAVDFGGTSFSCMNTGEDRPRRLVVFKSIELDDYTIQNSYFRNTEPKKTLELYLWRCAGLQNFEDGSFSLNPYRIFTDLQTATLQLFSSYDHPVAKLAILRALPWIINNQNEDSPWGTEPVKDATTYAVLGALLSVRDEMPSGFVSLDDLI